MIHKLHKLVDFTIDIARGCKHSCSGCAVDKENNEFPSESDFDKIDRLFDSFDKNNSEFLNFVIGPTDILSSENKDQILEHPRVKSLARRSAKTTLNCAFIEPNPVAYEELAEQVEALIPNGLLKFTVPFEIRHLDNPVYIEGIRKRIEYFESCLKTVKVTRVYAVVNFEEAIANDTKRGYKITEEIMTRVKKVGIHPLIHTDFILPHGRNDLRDPNNRDRFLISIHHINNLFIETYRIAKDEGQLFDLVELQSNEGDTWEITYRNGKLYTPPFVTEEFICFEPEYILHGEWTYDNIYNFKEDNLIECLDIAHSNNICTGCEFIHKCAERGMQKIMEITKSDRCIAVIKDMREDFNWSRRTQ